MEVNIYISKNYIYVEQEHGDSIAEFEIKDNTEELEREVLSLIEGLGGKILVKEYI
ncbi:MAG: hypothetical protein AB6733_10860 [Clostridiaceae bacterium]